ncbi:unnamed protein product [Moneuplotes crassus]|uniref:Uncharacterized protein n=1 Tax=Euplotes crassus TaxID=5936 RepID=A0AAD2D4X9_EUPCR|nr:unnamed protein product [Moneuplotes crassus]
MESSNLLELNNLSEFPLLYSIIKASKDLALRVGIDYSCRYMISQEYSLSF